MTIKDRCQEAKDFEPLTAGKKILERKRKLRDRFIQAIPDIEDKRKDCHGKDLSITVVFYLLGSSTEEGRSKKDLDNLPKVLLDVMSEHMTAQGTPIQEEGLGLITDDSRVFEINCRKKLIIDPTDEGDRTQSLRIP